jgi:acetate kinase
MTNAILVLNAGSSSLKFSVFRSDSPGESILRGQIANLQSSPRFQAIDASATVIAEQSWSSGDRLDHRKAIAFLLSWGRKGPLERHRIVAAGHRVVHGGVGFTEPVLLDAKVVAELKQLVPLAPLHQPHNVAAIEAVAHHAPDLPQVVCFDTSFHCTQPLLAQEFALPRRYLDQGIRRYGFHGLSYEYIASALPAVDSRAAKGRTIVAHLGNGASMCALQSGRSVATTMGFTALDGLMMGTRCGALDPGVLLYLLSHERLSASDIEDLLYHQSGLLGVSGISSDMRTLLSSRDPRAEEAIALFVYRIIRDLGSLAAALGGVDALVFTGGIGENAAAIRADVCRQAAWLGIQLDETANALGGPRITRIGSRVDAWVVPTDEERIIADHTRRVLAEASAGTREK